MRLKALPPIQGPEAAWTGLRWKRWRKCRYGWIKKVRRERAQRRKKYAKKNVTRRMPRLLREKLLHSRNRMGGIPEAIRQFRRTIAGYYQMEEENVEIGLED